MPRKGVNVSLSSYDDIFSTEQSRTEAGQEHVQEIPLEELHPFEGHPFKVLDNEEMDKTVESVRALGVVTPLIARPDPEGGYEIISGHRRHHAAELAGKETVPVIVREMDDDSAIILMVDANLQRSGETSGRTVGFNLSTSCRQVKSGGYCGRKIRRERQAGAAVYQAHRTDSAAFGYGGS